MSQPFHYAPRYVRYMKAYVQKDLHKNVYSSFIHNSQN